MFVRKLNFNLVLWCLARINGHYLALSHITRERARTHTHTLKRPTLVWIVQIEKCLVELLLADDVTRQQWRYGDGGDATKTHCMAFKYEKIYNSLCCMSVCVSPSYGSAVARIMNFFNVREWVVEPCERSAWGEWANDAFFKTSHNCILGPGLWPPYTEHIPHLDGWPGVSFCFEFFFFASSSISLERWLLAAVNASAWMASSTPHQTSSPPKCVCACVFVYILWKSTLTSSPPKTTVSVSPFARSVSFSFSLFQLFVSFFFLLLSLIPLINHSPFLDCFCFFFPSLFRFLFGSKF